MQGGSLPGSSTMWNEEVDVAQALRHKIEKLEPRYANDVIHFTMRAKSNLHIRWYALSAVDEQIQFLIDEAKSYIGLPSTQQLRQLPSLQPPSAWKLAQKDDQFDNVAHGTSSCANDIEGHSGEQLRSYGELTQEFLKLQLSEKSGMTNTIAPEIDSLLTHNLSKKKTESPEGDHATKVSNVGESSEFQDMEL